MSLHEHELDAPPVDDLDRLSLLQIALTRESERFRTLYATSPVGYVTTDVFGKVVEVNAAAVTTLQIEARFLVGKPILSYVAPSQRRRLRTWMLDLVRRGAPRTTSARMMRRSGVAFEAAITATPFGDEIWWAIVDETEQLQAEERAWELNRELDERVARHVRELQGLFDAFPFGIAVVDARTRRVYAKNQRALELLGHWDGHVPGVETTLADRDLWGVRRALDGESVPRAATRIPTKDGREVILTRRAVPLRDSDGAVVAAVLLFEEGADQRQREVVDAEFVENAAHQLRTPITAIAIAAAALEAGAKDEPDERERFVAHIGRESERMTRVIDALLGLARIQRGGAGLLVALVPVRPLVDEILTEVRFRDAVSVVVDCPADLAVLGEAPILREAVANVIANAALHTFEGSIRISAWRDGANAVLEIADSGPGVPPEVGERIFERFFRGDGTARSGAGLGLAIAAEAARANRGALELVPTEAGATFRFTLPGAKRL